MPWHIDMPVAVGYQSDGIAITKRTAELTLDDFLIDSAGQLQRILYLGTPKPRSNTRVLKFIGFEAHSNSSDEEKYKHVPLTLGQTILVTPLRHAVRTKEQGGQARLVYHRCCSGSRRRFDPVDIVLDADGVAEEPIAEASSEDGEDPSSPAESESGPSTDQWGLPLDLDDEDDYDEIWSKVPVAVQERIAKRHAEPRCECGGVQQYTLAGLRPDVADLLKRICLSKRHRYRFDPHLAARGDIFELQLSKLDLNKPHHTLCVYRAPGRIHPGELGETILIDPGLEGMWWGDGFVGSMAICASRTEVEVPAYMEKAVARVILDPGELPLQVVDYAPHDPGCARWHITTGAAGLGKTGVNHFKNIMRDQGWLDSKTDGFGDRVLRYPAVARRQFLGGAITTDGCYDPVNHTIMFSQQTEDHFNVARDFYRVCISLGIRATVHRILREPNPDLAVFETAEGVPCFKDGRTQHPHYIVRLTGSGIEQLQPYIISSRKQMRDTPMFFDNYSRRIISVTEGPQGMYREVVVEGGTAQHANGMILTADEPKPGFSNS